MSNNFLMAQLGMGTAKSIAGSGKGAHKTLLKFTESDSSFSERLNALLSMQNEPGKMNGGASKSIFRLNGTHDPKNMKTGMDIKDLMLDSDITRSAVQNRLSELISGNILRGGNLKNAQEIPYPLSPSAFMERGLAGGVGGNVILDRFLNNVADVSRLNSRSFRTSDTTAQVNSKIVNGKNFHTTGDIKEDKKYDVMSRTKQSVLLKQLGDSSGMAFVSNLKQYFMGVHPDLDNVSIGDEALRDIETLLVGAGFRPDDINSLVDTLTQETDDETINLSQFLDGLMSMDPERIVSNVSEIEKNLLSVMTSPSSMGRSGILTSDVNTDANQTNEETESSIFLSDALIPFLHSIFQEVGLPDDMSRSIIETSQVNGEGIDGNRLIQQLEVLQRETFLSGIRFQTTSEAQREIVEKGLHRIEMDAGNQGRTGDDIAKTMFFDETASNENRSSNVPIGLADLLRSLKRIQDETGTNPVSDFSPERRSTKKSSQINPLVSIFDKKFQDRDGGDERLGVDLKSFPQDMSAPSVTHTALHTKKGDGAAALSSLGKADGNGDIVLNSLEGFTTEAFDASDIHQLVERFRSGNPLNQFYNDDTVDDAEKNGAVSLRHQVLKSVLSKLVDPKESGDEDEDKFTMENRPMTLLEALLSSLSDRDGDHEDHGEGVSLADRVLNRVLLSELGEDGGVEAQAEAQAKVEADVVDVEDEITLPKRPMTVLEALLSGLSDRGSHEESGEGASLADRVLKRVLLSELGKDGGVEAQSEAQAKVEADVVDVDGESALPKGPVNALRELLVTLSEKNENETFSYSDLKNLLFKLTDKADDSFLAKGTDESGESAEIPLFRNSALAKVLSDFITQVEKDAGESEGQISLSNGITTEPDSKNEDGVVFRRVTLKSIYSEMMARLEGEDSGPKRAFLADQFDSVQYESEEHPPTETRGLNDFMGKAGSENALSRDFAFGGRDDFKDRVRDVDLKGQFRNPILFGTSEQSDSLKQQNQVQTASSQVAANVSSMMQMDASVEPFVNTGGYYAGGRSEGSPEDRVKGIDSANQRSVKHVESLLSRIEKPDGDNLSDSGQNGGGFNGHSDMKEGQLGVFRDKPASSTLPSYVTNQVFNSIRRAFTRGESEIRLQLKPMELGKIFMTINAHGDSVRVSVVTENQAAKELLAGHASDLKAILAANGIQVDLLDVEMGNDFSQSLADSGRQFDGSDASQTGRKVDRGGRRKAIQQEEQGVDSTVTSTLSDDNALHYVA